MHCNSCTESKYFNDVRHSIESADLNALARTLLLTIESLTSTEKLTVRMWFDLRFTLNIEITFSLGPILFVV